MDSTGLGVLVGRLKLVRGQDGTLRSSARSERILKVFTITGLDKVFQIFDSTDEALPHRLTTPPRQSDAATRLAERPPVACRTQPPDHTRRRTPAARGPGHRLDDATCDACSPGAPAACDVHHSRQ